MGAMITAWAQAAVAASAMVGADSSRAMKAGVMNFSALRKPGMASLLLKRAQRRKSVVVATGIQGIYCNQMLRDRGIEEAACARRRPEN
jgi:hypothetical protein